MKDMKYLAKYYRNIIYINSAHYKFHFSYVEKNIISSNRKSELRNP